MKDKILEILKNTDTYISGEEISRMLGISRAAVWKHIKKLKDEGYEIDSVTNKGYRLTVEPDKIILSEVNALLATDKVARNIIFKYRTDSTNEEAKRESSAAEGTLFVAEIQTAGKGRIGRKWETPKGAGIWMSLLLKPDISPREIAGITLIAGIAVCRAIGNGAKIKWPNDIVIGGRKVCGILTEMSAEEDWVNYVVCGIGINVNITSFSEDLREKATSLLIETGKKHSRVGIIAAVMNEFEPMYKRFKKSGFAPFRDEYKKLCVTVGKDVRVMAYRADELVGQAVDIDENGGLTVDVSGKEVTITSGDVSVRGIYGYI